MSSSRAQVAPVNLKERIAALQQRNVSPTPRSTSPVGNTATLNSAGLRDKIAKFERKGGIPVPRGSFGLGAPPLAENGPQRRRGELYGNRIPSAGRVVSGPLIAQPTSQLDPARSFSMSAMDIPPDDDEVPPSPTSPFLGLSVDHSEGREPLPRATRFSTALELAKQVESAGIVDPEQDGSISPSAAGLSTSQENLPTLVETVDMVEPEDQVVEDTPQPPIYIVVSSGEAAPSATEAHQVPEDPPMESAEEHTPETPDLSIDETTPTDQTQQASSPAEQDITPETSELLPLPTHPTAPTTPAIVISSIPETETAAGDTLSSTCDVSEQPPEAPINTAPQSDPTISGPAKTTDLVVEVTSPEVSPAGPFTLANAAKDLGKMIANMQDMFPGGVSPVITPTNQPSLRTPELAGNIALKSAPPMMESTKGPSPAVPVPVPAPSEDTPTTGSGSPTPKALKGEDDDKSQTPVAEAYTTPAGVSTLSPPQPLLRSQHVRPATMFETSPSNLSTGGSTFMPNSQLMGDKDYNHFPPTPDARDTRHSSATAHKPSHSVSDNTASKSTFTAVVYKKVAEPVRSHPSSSTTAFYRAAPQTPQAIKTDAPVLGNLLLSPGFGELSALLQDAARLELSLESGQLPGEDAGEEEEKRRRVETEKRAKEDAEKESKESLSRTSTKRESSDGKKSRNPMLRSKTWRKDDSGEPQANPVRARSVFLPFRSSHSQEPSMPRQSPHAPLSDDSTGRDSETASQKSSSTTPKSPRGYFASLRRFAGGSRSSTPSGAHSRHSVSTSSEMSSEDSASIPTPPGASNMDSNDSSNTEVGWNGGVNWPSTSPRKSSTMSRAASFMWGRSRTRSSMSAQSPYETIDRLTKAAATKSAVTLLPPMESLSYGLDIPDLPSPPEHLISPGRSNCAKIPSTNSQFPPTYTTQPASPVYSAFPNSEEPRSIDSVFAGTDLTDPTHTSSSGQGGGRSRTKSFLAPLDENLFSAKPTSPVYTPHQPMPEFRLEEANTLPDDYVMVNPRPRLSALGSLPSPGMPDSPTMGSPSFLSSPGFGGGGNIRDSWISADSSMDASVISLIPGPLVDSFPSVPPRELPGVLASRPRSNTRTGTGSGSFFESTPPLASTVGLEFLPAGRTSMAGRRSTSASVASSTRVSGELRR